MKMVYVTSSGIWSAEKRFKKRNRFFVTTVVPNIAWKKEERKMLRYPITVPAPLEQMLNDDSKKITWNASTQRSSPGVSTPPFPKASGTTSRLQFHDFEPPKSQAECCVTVASYPWFFPPLHAVAELVWNGDCCQCHPQSAPHPLSKPSAAEPSPKRLRKLFQRRCYALSIPSPNAAIGISPRRKEVALGL